MKQNNLIQYSFWNWGEGRKGWWNSPLYDNEDENEDLQKVKSNVLLDYRQYSEDDEWRYYYEGVNFDMNTRIRIKKLICPHCGKKI